jgi:large subunit ribosomal protein L29
MKASEIRDFDEKELGKRVAELRKEVFGLRFSNATGELDDTAALSRAKRDLARALTVTRERELTTQHAHPAEHGHGHGG